MDQPITIDSAGRIVLPADVRRRLNLRAGSRLQLEVVLRNLLSNAFDAVAERSQEPRRAPGRPDEVRGRRIGRGPELVEIAAAAK